MGLGHYMSYDYSHDYVQSIILLYISYFSQLILLPIFHFSTYQYYADCSRKTMCSSLKYSIFSFLLCVCSANFRFSAQRSLPVSALFLPFCAAAWKSPQDSERDNIRAYLNCFPFFKGCCLSLVDIQSIEYCCFPYIFFFFFLVHSGER